jgi:hypothetical protein
LFSDPMSSALFTAVCSIAPTRRRRFLWAAWWTAAPTKKPFRKPDASEGGARTREEALRAAENAAARPLLEIESGWARAWANVLVGKEPWAGQRASGDEAPIRPKGVPSNPSVWSTLGLKADATVTQIKSAYKKRALETHPDRGGTSADFRALQAAYESALKRRARSARKSKER